MKLVLVFLFALFSIASLSQSPKNYKIIEGPEMQGKRSSIEQVIGVMGENILICRKEKNKYFLEVIDQSAAIIKSVPLGNLEFEGSKKQYVDALILKNKLFVRFSAINKRNKIVIGIIDEYDIESLTFKKNISADKTSIDGAKKIYWYGIGVNRAISELSESGFYISNDRNYVVDYSSSFDKAKDTEENISMRVYDENMSLFWEKEFKMPYSNDLFKITKVIVDEKGNTHLLGKEFFEKNADKKRGKTNFKYHVISFLSGGKSIKDNTIELDSEFITDATLGITSEGYLIASGFYSSVGSYSINGAFSVKIDIDKKRVISTNKKEFENSFIRSGMTSREIKRSEKKENKGEDLEMPDFDLDHLVLMPDGGWMLMAEQFYITTRTYMTSGPNGSMQTRTEYVYNYDDIILVRMNNKGEIIWNVKVGKHQSSSGSTARLSYSWFYCNDTLYILYNGSPGSSSNLIYAEVISADGVAVKETIMQGGRDELYMLPRFSARTKNCQLLIYSARKKTYQFSLMNATN